MTNTQKETLLRLVILTGWTGVLGLILGLLIRGYGV